MRWRRRKRGAGGATGDGSAPAVVIGGELAAARAIEDERRAAHPDRPSPLGVAYDGGAGEHDLARFVASPVDDQVRRLVRAYLDSDVGHRSTLRTALTMDDLYTVLAFSRRATVAALRARSAATAREALLALALVDLERIDWRDLIVAFDLAAFAVHDTAGGLPAALQELRSVSTPEVGAVTERLDGTGREPTLEASGYSAVTTARYGLGLVSSWDGQGSTDLASLLVGLADAVEDDDYRSRSVHTGGGLPSVWFPAEVRPRVEQLVESAAATGSVGGEHRSAPRADGQQFTVFVVDMGSPEAADELRRLAGTGEPGGHAVLALAHRAVFVLVIARSFVQGVEGIETSGALRRFAAPFLDVLRST